MVRTPILGHRRQHFDQAIVLTHDAAKTPELTTALKAMLRVCADLSRVDAEPADGRIARWTQRLQPWSEQVRQFRSEGFYERFPAKGQVERTSRIHKELARVCDIETGRPKAAKQAAS